MPEFHQEQINPADEPVIWAAVLAERQNDARPGFSRDGYEANEPGETTPLDHLRRGFACDGGLLRIIATLAGDAECKDAMALAERANRDTENAIG